jgi:hypothetical protein
MMLLASMPLLGPVEKSSSTARETIIEGEGKILDSIKPALTASSQITRKLMIGIKKRMAAIPGREEKPDFFLITTAGSFWLAVMLIDFIQRLLTAL